jgi:hypothetical protein
MEMDNFSDMIARARDSVTALRRVASEGVDSHFIHLDSELSLYQAFIDTITSLTNDQLLGYYFEYLQTLNLL